GEAEPVKTHQRESPQDEIVERGNGGGRAQSVSGGEVRRLAFRLLGTGAVAALSIGAVIYGTAYGRGHAAAPDIAGVAGSPLFFLGLTAAFGASILAARLVESGTAGRSGAAFAVVIGVAAALRIIALPATPGLSDDIYRYLWDGHVQAAGINPYLHAPAAPQLDPLATAYRDRINNPELPTIYPPVSQMVFLAASLAGGSVVAMKGLLCLIDMGTILTLAAILRRRGMAPSRVVIYAWSPLAILEVGWNGHQDAAGVLLLTLAVLGIEAGRGGLSMAAGALSGAAKYIGWLVLPCAARRSKGRARLWWIAAPAAAAIAWLPYAGAGWKVLGSLGVYAEQWRFNDSLFAVLLRAVETLGLPGLARTAIAAAGLGGTALVRFAGPLWLAKGIAAALFVAFAVRVLRRGWEDPLRHLLALVGAALLLSPTLHPWYLLWIVPLMAIVPRVSWLWLSWAILVCSYPMMALKLAGLPPAGWLGWVEYVPFFVMLAVESARRRLWEADGGGWVRTV
ncbi:MAG TPA: hypothetical protein VNI57_08945, partial [Candidatus Saccharimonadales bacterium]|nr:hypothetical protein [Candidatus Saccharimonadales bacterium]